MLVSRFILPGVWSHGRGRVAQVPREPQGAFARLSDPGRTSTPSLRGASVLLPLFRRRELLPLPYFEALGHGFSTGGLHFVPPSRATTQNSLPGVASLSRVGFKCTH